MDLLVAVAQGNCAKVKDLLAVQPSFASSARDTRSGATALHIAAQRGHCEILADLIASAGDVHARDGQGATPLIASAGGGTAAHTVIARMLVDAGADVDACDAGGLRALHEAAECGDERMLRMLLDAGAQPNAQAHSTGATALHILVASGGETYFGASWTDAERRGEATLGEAAAQDGEHSDCGVGDEGTGSPNAAGGGGGAGSGDGDGDFEAELHSQEHYGALGLPPSGVDDGDAQIAIKAAFSRRALLLHPDKAKRVSNSLPNDAKNMMNGSTVMPPLPPSTPAMSKNQAEECDREVRFRRVAEAYRILSNPSTRRCYDALRSGGGARVACAKLLRDRGADVHLRAVPFDQLSASPSASPDAEISAGEGTTGVLAELLAQARVNNGFRQPKGDTAFELAVRFKNWSLAAAIGLPLQPGGGDELRDRQQRSVLHHATAMGDVHWVTQLLRLGANPGATDAFGTTPLLQAAGLGSKSLIEALLNGDENKAATLELADDAGQTPLIAAVYSGELDAAQLLLAAGANRSTHDSAGQNAAYYAAELMHDKMIKLLAV
eukprot:g1537.t1